MKEEKLQEAAECIISAITPSLEPEEDNLNAALARVRVLVKAKLEEKRWPSLPTRWRSWLMHASASAAARLTRATCTSERRGGKCK